MTPLPASNVYSSETLPGALAPDAALAFVSLNVSPDLATHPDNVTSDDCGAGAGPEWQAEILSRFHPAIHGVVVTEQQGGAVRKIKAKGKVFGPPAVIDGALNFYVVEPEANIVSQVKATLGDTVQVEVTQL